MLTHSDIQRSIGKMTIDLSKAMERRAHAADDYGLAEREFRTQFEFFGKVGVLPAEAAIKVAFSVLFLADPGLQTDSQLDRPHTKLTFEMLFGPAGLIPFGYVTEWIRDNDFNYIGAKVNVGVHYPGLSVEGGMPSRFDFKGICHATFAGFGALVDGNEILSATLNTGGARLL